MLSSVEIKIAISKVRIKKSPFKNPRTGWVGVHSFYRFLFTFNRKNHVMIYHINELLLHNCIFIADILPAKWCCFSRKSSQYRFYGNVSCCQFLNLSEAVSNLRNQVWNTLASLSTCIGLLFFKIATQTIKETP